MISHMLGEERSGKGLNHMTSEMKGQGSELHDEQYARGGWPPGGEVLSFQFC